MRRPFTFWLGLLGSCWLPALALAQLPTTPTPTTTQTGTTGGLMVFLMTIGDEPYNQRGTPIGKRQCDANDNLHFRVSGFATGPASPKYVEIYKGTACNTTEGKDMQGDDNCERVLFEDRQQSNPIQEFDVPLKDLCSTDGDVTLFFLPVDTLNTNENVVPYGVIDVPIDIIPLDAPKNVKGGVGESEIPITWEGSGQTAAQNWLVWDRNPTAASEGDGGDVGDASTGEPGCSSSELVAGQEFDLDTTDLPKKRVVGDVYSATLTAKELGVRRAPLAVIAEDLAENRSVLSNVTCVEVVPTDGFWDTYKDAGGTAEPGCGCSVPGRHSRTKHDAQGLLAALALLALCGVRLRRKRTS